MWNIGAYHRGMMAGRTPNLDGWLPRHDLHRLLRRGELHGRSRELYHRRAAIRTGMTTVDRPAPPSACAEA